MVGSPAFEIFLLNGIYCMETVLREAVVLWFPCRIPSFVLRLDESGDVEILCWWHNLSTCSSSQLFTFL